VVTNAHAQQFVTPGAQSLPYGGLPALRVAPDGAVHLDGPGAQFSQPTYVAQPRQVPVTTTGSRFANWLYNDPVPWQYNHRHGFFGDFLYLRPRNAEVAYALPIEGVVALGDEVPIGPVAIVDQEFEPGFRTGAVIRLTDGASIRGQYSYFRSNASASATILGPNVLRSLVTHPNVANAATDTLDASAQHDINFDLIDTDYRGLILGCESCTDCRCAIMVNGIVGGRYANLEQQFRSTFSVTGTRTVDTNIDFDGGGIRLGIEAEHHATTNGLYVYGSGITNLMVGEFTADYRQTLSVNGVNGQEAFTSWKAGRIVPTLDLELGFGWVGPRRRLKFSGGYLVSTWFNVVKTEDFINAVHNSDFDDLSGILTFDGLVARATWEF
jgi:hypothetical protein